jgi:hypothetical protein
VLVTESVEVQGSKFKKLMFNNHQLSIPTTPAETINFITSAAGASMGLTFSAATMNRFPEKL